MSSLALCEPVEFVEGTERVPLLAAMGSSGRFEADRDGIAVEDAVFLDLPLVLSVGWLEEAAALGAWGASWLP